MANTSQGPAITSANIPRPVGAPLSQQSPAVQATAAKVAEAALDSVVAAPLIEPDFVNLRPVNPNVAFRWVLHTLFKKDGTQSILRFEQAKAQGYQVATKADIQNPPHAYEQDGGTKYVNGDLVLMKISRAKYQGAILHREQQAAKQMMSTTGRRAQKGLLQTLEGSRSQTSKINAFNPTEAELREFGAVEAESDE